MSNKIFFRVNILCGEDGCQAACPAASFYSLVKPDFFADGSVNMFESTTSLKWEHFTSNEIKQARFRMYNLFNTHFHILE